MPGDTHRTGADVPPSPDAKRLPCALVTLAVWLVVTFSGGALLQGSTDRTLEETVATGIGWNLLAAIAVLALTSSLWGWRDLKFNAPNPVSSLRQLWFPSLSLVLLAAAVLAAGMPPAATTAYLALNCALVGLSEEWMFRGILFQALRSRLALWPALVLSSLIFGLAHVGNALMTSNLAGAAFQALAAAMSGTLFAALLLRTGSIWPAVAYHALWDFGLLINVSSTLATPVSTEPDPLLGYAIPFALVLPNFLCALYLLRGIRVDADLRQIER